MTTTVDAKILLYAADEESPLQERALALVKHLMTGPALVYILWPVVMAYLRTGTNPRLFDSPLSPESAMAAIDRLLAPSHIRVVGEGEDFWDAYRLVAEDVKPRGNLVTDAHLVALMRQHGVSTIWTRDRDFRKFDGISVKDPFAEKYAKGFD